MNNLLSFSKALLLSFASLIIFSGCSESPEKNSENDEVILEELENLENENEDKIVWEGKIEGDFDSENYELVAIVDGEEKVLTNDFIEEIIEQKFHDNENFDIEGNELKEMNLKGEIIKNADPKTFEVFQCAKDYSKDKNNVYFNGEITSVDPNTVQDVCITTSHTLSHLIKDDKNVYYNAEPIEGADPDTFSKISNSSTYFRDKNNVYFENTIIPHADSNTFEIMNFYHGEYTKDKNNIYYKTNLVSGADPDYFENIEKCVIGGCSPSHYYQGKYFWQIYTEGEKLSLLDVVSFKIDQNLFTIVIYGGVFGVLLFCLLFIWMLIKLYKFLKNRKNNFYTK